MFLVINASVPHSVNEMLHLTCLRRHFFLFHTMGKHSRSSSYRALFWLIYYYLSILNLVWSLRISLLRRIRKQHCPLVSTWTQIRRPVFDFPRSFLLWFLQMSCLQCNRTLNQLLMDKTITLFGVGQEETCSGFEIFI